MSHDEVQDLLEAYVDERLDRHTRRNVDSHLQDCEKCRSLLDGVAPVDLGDGGVFATDTGAIRRSIRRSMARSLADAVALLLATVLAAWLLTAVVVLPLVVGRDGRAEAATLATMDLVTMFNPGVAVYEWEYTSAWLSRTSVVTATMQVGGSARPVDEFISRIGILDFGDGAGGTFDYSIPRPQSLLEGSEQLRRLGAGTVATVIASPQEPLEIGDAQASLVTTRDVSFTWAGFVAPADQSGSWMGVLGYGLCAPPRPPVSLGGTSGSGGTSQVGVTASIVDALKATRSALSNLSAHPEIAEGAWFEPGEIARAAESLDDPLVAAVVVTGPSEEVLAYLDDEGFGGEVLAIDFYNWGGSGCKA